LSFVSKALACCSKHFCAHDAFVIRRTPDLRRDDIARLLAFKGGRRRGARCCRHIPLKTPLSLASRVAAFFGSTTHFSQSVFFSLDFLSSAFLKTRAREGRVLFLWFFGRRRSKSGFFVHEQRVFRSPSEGAERRTRARRVQSLSRNEKDAYFLSLFFLEFATENAADGVNKNKTTREDGSTTNNRRAGKERR